MVRKTLGNPHDLNWLGRKWKEGKGLTDRIPPPQPGVYRLRDARVATTLLYVGKTRTWSSG